ncbi:MAG TPA: hypothetical protein VMW65_07150, partial [Chloroflexota bacterium]|nr:hypothetical protein [Chloroflexota bacterium]
MLVLSALAGSPVADATVFPDHQDQHLLYFLPPGLRIAMNAAGEPDFFLMRYHGDFAQAEGGLLRVTLNFAAVSDASLAAAHAAGWTVRAVGFSAGQFRLRLRSLVEGKDDVLGEWRPLALASEQLIVPAVGLTSHEVELLHPLLESGQSSVEVDVDLRYHGMIRGQSWLATAQTVALKRVLAVLLPAQPALADQIVAAFQSLPSPLDGLVHWQPLESGAAEPPRDAMLAEIAMRSLATLFNRQPSQSPFDPQGYQLVPIGGNDPATSSWDLSTARQEERSDALTWSVTDLYQRLASPEERQKFFPTVSQVSPFAQVTIHVVNQLPLDARFLRKVQVAVRYPGVSGLPEYHTSTFDGQSQVDRFSVTYPSLTTTFQLAIQITATLAPRGGTGWPVILKRDWTPVAGLLVDVGRKEVGIEFVRVEA